MDKSTVRIDDFDERRKHLQTLSDEELKALFWTLADQTIEPLIRMAKSHTSPSIERSVLLRMGFSSIEAKAIVDLVLEHHLIGKGAGHCVYLYAQIKQLSIREAGLSLMKKEGWEDVVKSFGGSSHESK